MSESTNNVSGEDVKSIERDIKQQRELAFKLLKRSLNKQNSNNGAFGKSKFSKRKAVKKKSVLKRKKK